MLEICGERSHEDFCLEKTVIGVEINACDILNLDALI